MTDLTVLVSPIPLYPSNNTLFSRGPQPQRRPIMVTLETTIDETLTQAEADSTPGRDAHGSQRAVRTVVDPALLSPPVNTFKSRQNCTRHRPTRSQSAPPGRRVSQETQQQNCQQEEDPYRFLRPERRASTPPPTRGINFSPPTVGRLTGEPVRPPPPLCMHLSSPLSPFL
jgi:hypothetical protein